MSIALAVFGACDPGESEFGAGQVAMRPGGGGVKLNTNKIGQHLFSELDVSGARHHGVKLARVTLAHGAQVLDAVWVEDGVIRGRAGALEVSGTAFLGSTWDLVAELDGHDVDAKLRVTAITPTQHTLVYDFEQTYTGGPKWPLPSCDEDPELGGSFGAVVTADISVDAKTGVVSQRPNTLFIGCLSGGVGKAGYWGYPLHLVGQAAFEAAIRMVRADYCGTGTSFTSPGVPLEVKDIFGINQVELFGATEAIWGGSGALCLNEPRKDELSGEDIAATCKALAGNVPAKCAAEADLDSEAGLLWTRNL